MLQSLKNKLRLIGDKKIEKHFFIIWLIFSVFFAIKVIFSVENELLIDLAGEWLMYVTIKGFICTGVTFAIFSLIKKVMFFKG